MLLHNMQKYDHILMYSHTSMYSLLYAKLTHLMRSCLVLPNKTCRSLFVAKNPCLEACEYIQSGHTLAHHSVICYLIYSALYIIKKRHFILIP